MRAERWGDAALTVQKTMKGSLFEMILEITVRERSLCEITVRSMFHDDDLVGSLLFSEVPSGFAGMECEGSIYPFVLSQ